MNNFITTPEYIQSIKMRPACNRVLSYVFGIDENSIIRYSKEDDAHAHILDKEFAIDLKVLLPNKMQLSAQEKALTHKFYKYRTFTIEFYQNRFTKEPGEWFKIASQFYLSGYSDESGFKFIEWKIIKMFDFMLWLRKHEVSILEKRCKPSKSSRASFLPIPYDDIPKECIYAEYKDGKVNINGTIKDLLKKV